MDLSVLVLMEFLCLPGRRGGRVRRCSSRRHGCSCICCRRATRQARRRGRKMLLQKILVWRIWCIDREVGRLIPLLRSGRWSVHGAGRFAMGVAVVLVTYDTGIDFLKPLHGREFDHARICYENVKIKIKTS